MGVTTMRITFLPMVRWWRDARKDLPETRYTGQPISERCREIQTEEVRWFTEIIERTTQRRE